MGQCGACLSKIAKLPQRFKQLWSKPESHEQPKFEENSCESEVGYGSQANGFATDPQSLISSQTVIQRQPDSLKSQQHDQSSAEESENEKKSLKPSDEVPSIQITGALQNGLSCTTPASDKSRDVSYLKNLSHAIDPNINSVHQTVKPTKKELRYVMCPEQLPQESTECLLAPVSPDRSITDGERKSRELADVLADNSKSDGAFRRVHIRFDGDPNGDRARVQHIMHDTGAGCSLTFEGKLRNLGLEFEHIAYDTDLISVTGERFRPIGKRQICFSYYNRPHKKHWTDIIVLPDPTHGMEPAFDMLFGRDTIKKVKAIIWDKEIIGFVHTSALCSNFPALLAPSPRPSPHGSLIDRPVGNNERSTSPEMSPLLNQS